MWLFELCEHWCNMNLVCDIHGSWNDKWMDVINVFILHMCAFCFVCVLTWWNLVLNSNSNWKQKWNKLFLILEILNRGGRITSNHLGKILSGSGCLYITVSVKTIKEAGGLREPPPLMGINRGGWPNSPASVNVLTVAGRLTALVKATIYRDLWTKTVGLPASVKEKRPPW
jgi:hypothetical protein